MADQSVDAADASPQEIIFNCPHCHKSLSIDSRGRGMMIACPDCGERIEVPSTEHSTDVMTDVRDFRIQELEEALAQSDARVKDLTSLLREYSSRRSTLEEMRTANMKRFKSLRKEVAQIQEALSRIVTTLEDVSEDGQGG